MVIRFESIQETRALTSTHQKCNAKQPCAACVSGDRVTECTYDSRQPRSRPTGTNTPSVSRNETPGPIHLHNLPSQAPFEPSTDRSSDLPLSIWSDSSESGFSLPLSLSPALQERPSTQAARLPWELSPRIHNELVQRPSSDTPATHKVNGTTKCIPYPAVSSFTVLPSIHFQAIPRPLRVPLSFIPPEHVQVSEVAGDDLGMSLYVFFRFHEFPPSHED